MVVFFMLAVCRKLCLVGFSACVCKGTTLLATQSAPMVRLAYGVPLDLVWAQSKSFGRKLAKERLVQECGLACWCRYKAVESVCMGRCAQKQGLVVAGEVLAFGLCPQAKPLLPVIDNTIKSELATQHVTPAQHFMVMTTAGKLYPALTLFT